MKPETSERTSLTLAMYHGEIKQKNGKGAQSFACSIYGAATQLGRIQSHALMLHVDKIVMKLAHACTNGSCCFAHLIGIAKMFLQRYTQ